MTTDQLKTTAAKLRSVHPQEVGLRAGATAELIEELVRFREQRVASFPGIADLINSAPERLRRYVHDLETSWGNEAHIVQDNFRLSEENKQLRALIEKPLQNYYPLSELGKFLNELQK